MKQSAKKLRKNLIAIDRLITKAILTDRLDRITALQRQQREHVDQALEQDLKLINIQVADGYALYYESIRTKSLATFEWLYSPDDYESGFGRVVSVPLKIADALIMRFNPKHL